MERDIQKKLIENNKRDIVTEEEFYSILKLVSPGTTLRKALEGILSSGKGALIVVENEYLPPLIDGGFRINCKFSYQKLIELSKMDGAMILSNDLKKIISANVLLTPNSKIKTFETGTRHKAAERTAKQISGLIIAVSERKKEIVLFYKDKRYPIRGTREIVEKVNNHIQLLEKQRELFDTSIDILNKLELRNYVNITHAIKTIQKGIIILKISEELSKYLIELGSEGSLIKNRLKEILHDIEEETNLVIKDYSKNKYKDSISQLYNLSYEELLEKDNILKILNYENPREIVNILGWRILSKTSLIEEEIENLVKDTKISEILNTDETIRDFEPISTDKFALLKVELERLKLGI